MEAIKNAILQFIDNILPLLINTYNFYGHLNILYVIHKNIHLVN